MASLWLAPPAGWAQETPPAALLPSAPVPAVSGPVATGSAATGPDALAPGAQAPSATAPDDEPSWMKMLAARGEHNLDDERWNLYGQLTYIEGYKDAFYAKYTNLNGSINSLLPGGEQSFTGSMTLYLGAKAWKGGEVYFVPELISERPLSGLKGLGGAIQDFELQKGGGETPTVYISRAFLRQTFEFGGEPVKEDSGEMQLGTTYKSRRLVFEVGNFSILDFLDKSQLNIDPRQGMFSLAFMTYAAYDFASDARGYSYGGVAEFYWDKWAMRYGRITPPKEPNQLPVTFQLAKFYGDQVEFEHDHQWRGQEGMVRVLAFRNREDIGKFSDAIAAFKANPQENATTCTTFNYGSHNAGAPDLCWARKPNTKEGIGMYGEQYVLPGIGLYARGMYADGKTEVDAYTPTDRSLTVGMLGKGNLWGRPKDVVGSGLNLGWISNSHIQYLKMGGVDGFIGDGYITPGKEIDVDGFYSVNFAKSFWLSADYQRVTNPGFNRDRGPVDIFSMRLHAEF